ncbi:MAG: dihydrolipoyl dehydrogenase [Phycisphaerales bacterium]|nr:dihydrolipoyl dehydrogenase [Phycisphaerales bacterium]
MVVGELTESTDLLVIGGGPGGYVAAFKAADLGVQTTIVDAAPVLGGVCLREGCIPSKALLSVAHLVDHAAHAKEFGISFESPKIDVEKLRTWKQGVVDRLCNGINTLAKKRNVRVIRGTAHFEDSKTVRIDGGEAARIKFKHCIIATGSRAKRLPETLLPADCCIDSTGALELEKVPKSLLVIGGGYIGLELGQVYAGLGSQVTVMEALDRICAGADPDLARVLEARLKKQFLAILTSVKIERAKKVDAGVEITYTRDGKTQSAVFEKILVSVGRQPNTDNLGLQNTKVVVNPRGFIEVDDQRRTADKKIFAIGDVAGDPMLAHKASREGIVAAEVIAGHNVTYDVKAIPAVVYTSPEVAWCGLTEAEAKAKGLEFKVGKFPWGASGRAIAMGRPEGLTKIIADATNRQILGVGIVGEHAGDLIAEAVLAMEMGAEPDDLALTVHPHPSTSETVMEAAESVFGSAIHTVK